MNKKVVFLTLFCLNVFFSCSAEKKDWKTAQVENTKEAYQVFLERHSKGSYTDTAKLALEKIDFAHAQSLDVIHAYKDLLSLYPKGALASQACQKIEDLYFRRAKHGKSIPAFQNYLKLYPNGKYVGEARQRIDKIIKEQRHPELQNLKTVKIVVNQTFDRAKDVSFPIELYARFLMSRVGVELSDDKSEHYDAILSVSTQGSARSGSYPPHGRLYTGASLSGTFTIEIPGGQILKRSFKGYVEPPRFVSYMKGSAPREHLRRPGKRFLKP